MNEWQSIDTAPSDGKRVWTWNARQPHEPVRLQSADGEWWRLGKEHTGMATATHWMPFEPPEPPILEPSRFVEPASTKMRSGE